MNKLYKIGLLGVFAATLFSCNDSFMDRYPTTSITDKVFFSNVKDLETYTNGLYGIIGSSYSDVVSDNANSNEDPSLYQLLRGEITVKNAGTWSWSTLRKINFLIENAYKTVGDKSEVDHYVGIARLFRASHYYGKVKTYSDVPWYSTTLKTTDKELLYKTQDSRKLVVDSIMADLDFAVKTIKDSDSKTRLTKWSALAIQARIALNEGTFRKYHPELELTDGDRFLEIARTASKEIIEKGSRFSLHTEKKDMEPYRALFISQDLSRNPEIIMYEAYSKTLSRFHNAQAMFNNYHGLSRDLQEDYLALQDGKAVPFHEVAGYDKMSFIDVFKNRDPRMGYTFMQPGYIRAGENIPSLGKLGLGGYPQVKYDPLTYDQIGWDKSYTDLPIIRLGEVYLIYAEACAELGTLTQNDLELTINKLRARVGMPSMQLGEVLSDVDPKQEQRYPNVTGSMKGAILEIRRERRIELACEGFRKDDLFRWKAGQRLVLPFEGIYVDKLGYIDLTGDGLPNIAIVATQEDADKIPEEDKSKYKLTIYILKGNTFYLSEGDHGFVRMTAHKDKFTFIEPKYYYWPLDEKDISINKNLKQNKYWE